MHAVGTGLDKPLSAFLVAGMSFGHSSETAVAPMLGSALAADLLWHPHWEVLSQQTCCGTHTGKCSHSRPRQGVKYVGNFKQSAPPLSACVYKYS